jgi:hypothetical protein
VESVEMDRKPYKSPKLVVHGSLTKLTGGSKNTGKDANATQTKNP